MADVEEKKEQPSDHEPKMEPLTNCNEGGSPGMERTKTVLVDRVSSNEGRVGGKADPASSSKEEPEEKVKVRRDDPIQTDDVEEKEENSKSNLSEGKPTGKESAAVITSEMLPERPAAASPSRSSFPSTKLGDFPKPATHDGSVGRVGDEPMQLVLRPARPATEGVANGVQNDIRVSALPRSSARVLKAQIRFRCPALSVVADDRIRILYRGVELPDDEPLLSHIPSVGGDGSVGLQFLVLEGVDNGVCQPGLYVGEGVPCEPEIEAVLLECSEGLRKGVQPSLAMGGTGGTYFLRSCEEGTPLAVFKPKDEEAGTPQNPRGYEAPENSRTTRPGVPSTQRAVREVAAQLIDHGRFAGVPFTTLAHGRHVSFQPLKKGGDVVWKVGAFQAFIDTAETADNFGPQMYGDSDVHKVGMLDIRIANLDRNYGNILVKVDRAGDGSRNTKLVPIDHGCSLPDRLGISVGDVVWMGWPQTKKPFGIAERRYISSLNGQKDAELLATRLGLERDGLRLLETTTKWLQLGAARGMTLHEIGSCFYRQEPEDPNMEILADPSPLENIIEDCLDVAIAQSELGALQRCGTALGQTHLDRSITVSSAPKHVRDLEKAKGGIFFRCDAQGQEIVWNDHLEETFRRHTADSLERLVRARAPAPTVEPPTKVAVEDNVLFSEKQDGEDEKPTSPKEETEVLTLPKRSAKAYVPPHLRKAKPQE